MMALREFTNADEMLEFYRELRARMRALGPPPPAPVLVVETPAPEPPPPEPEPPPPPPPVFLLPPSRIKMIIRAAAAEFDMPPEAACSASRNKQAVVLRHVVALLARELTGLSYPAIGIALGQRDHTTVMHAINSMRHRIADDPVLAMKVGRVRRRLLEQSNQGEKMTSRRLLDPVTRTLLDAADLIEKLGWWDGSGPEPTGSTLCADLAIGAAAKGKFETYDAAYQRMCYHIGRDHIPKWNDNEARSAKAVIAALRAAALG